jgi:tRNA dimethylallyltransferase
MTRPLVAVLGPTASGKSGLAELLAEQRGGELVNADASALYRELEVGVTKPDAATRRRLRYHLLDVAELSQTVTVVDYQQMASRAVEEISSRGRLPILVGGSSLYARAFLDGYQPSQIEVPAAVREQVRALPLERAVAELERRDPDFCARLDRRNPRRVSRALELVLAAGGPVPAPSRRPPAGLAVLRLILQPDKALLQQRIGLRTEAMWQSWREEVLRLEKKGLAHWLEVRKPIGYATVAAHLQGKCTREEAIAEVVRCTHLLAKKQRTWLQKDTEGPDRHHFVLASERDWEALPELALRLLDGFLARFTREEEKHNGLESARCVLSPTQERGGRGGDLPGQGSPVEG